MRGPVRHEVTPSRRTPSLGGVVELLRKHYGAPLAPPTSDLFELILWENIAYLASPERKRLAFEKLRASVGTRPEQILAARERDLQSVAAYGILGKGTVAKLRECARIAMEMFAGDLPAVQKESIPAAVKLLRVFPSIGKPGAERVLLFANRPLGLAPESNGIRVLGRVGLIPQDRAYAGIYEAARRLSLGARVSPTRLQQAHLLLQTHGRSLCRRKAPRCSECPLRKCCSYAAAADMPRRS